MASNNILASLETVTKSFGDVVAVSEVSFYIPEGSIMGFLGPNGSGKTTSIRMLLGLTRPDTGKVSLYGQNPFTDLPVKQITGYVPERDLLYRWITAKDYLTSFGRYQLPKEEAKKRALTVLDEVGLGEVANKRINTFSKGMRQRMKVAQSLVHKPTLIVADEPFNGLDPVVRANLFDLIRHYRQEYGTTFFISSHILFEVERLANNIVLLYKGRTIAQGSPKGIRQMIQEQPHSIQITTKDVKPLIKLLVDHDAPIRSIELATVDSHTFEVQTHKPTDFYKLLTNLVVDNNLVVQELRATDEGLESLFRTLTVG